MNKIRATRQSIAIVALLAICIAIAAQEAAAPMKPTKELAASGRAVVLVGEGPGPRMVAKSAEQGQKPGASDKSIAPRPGPMSVGMDILVDGKPLRTVQHKGKTYLPVPKVGAEYEIRVWNHGPHRVVAVLSVDGLDVINGQAASESNAGYIVAPYSQVRIQGWRRNLDAVAAFAFVDRAKSYANLTGRPENIGVIGLIAIEEYVWTPRPALEKGDSAKATLRAQVGSIGTEYGREIDSRVHYVPFVRSNNKRAITIYYDTVAELRKAGVPVDPPMPVPFPKDSEFAPPPPGYKGKIN